MNQLGSEADCRHEEHGNQCQLRVLLQVSAATAAI